MPKWVPNCAADAWVRGARASCPSISCRIGNPFWLNWGQEESKTVGNLKVNVNPSKTTNKDHHICQTQVFGPRTWVWARCGHCWLFWERFEPKVFSCKRAPKQPTKTTSGPNPGFRAQNLGLGQMWSFWVVLRRFTPKVSTSGPSPWLMWPRLM